ncbi:uncharacterized protein LOC132723554 [Ruditapes philippinarum]|uniref:uncharacterized protein LOC132723554 n=1 Tax=Ruditapes philippinarum TaxID=129788 RepID=UPI00295C0534|nr:uncharacterized protein LOC132723554 [Ruditapes philippinarum]
MAAMDESNKEMQHSVENTSSTDGSVGRMKILRNVMLKTIKSFTGELKLVSPLTGVDNTHLEHLHSKTISQLEANIQCELEQMYKEENLETLLNSLDKIIAENPSQPGTVAWRPSGNVKEDVRCEVGVLKREKLKALKQTLNDLEAQNKLLRDKVQEREQHLLRTRDKIVSIADDFEEIVDTENITD